MVNRLSMESARSPKLPPIDAAPLLAYIPAGGTLPMRYAIEAPVDDRGVVLPAQTVKLAMETVDPSYKWPTEHCDVHHFVWERSRYLPTNNDGDDLPYEYREVPFHKGYLPRQLHNYIHVIMLPPPMPTHEVMLKRVKAYYRAKLLFSTARRAIKLEREFDRSSIADSSPEHVRGIFGENNVIEFEALLEVYDRFLGQYQSQLDGLEGSDFDNIIDLDQFRQLQRREATASLGRLAAISSLNLIPMVSRYS